MTNCPHCNGDILDAGDYSTCDTCDWTNADTYHREEVIVDCAITLLPADTCSHCTKPAKSAWIDKVYVPGFSPDPTGHLVECDDGSIHQRSDAASLDAQPPVLPAVEVSTKATTNWGPTTMSLRPVPRPRGFHWQVSGRPGGYIEGSWMDDELPDVDLLDQPIEDSWV